MRSMHNHSRRRRRGDVRTAVLAVLHDQPGHGYEIIQALEERTGGRWRPSPGSVYPTLQQLDDEGLVRAEERDGRRVYTLTDAGRTEAEERLAEGNPWSGGGSNLGANIKQLAMAYKQVTMAGSPEQIQRADEIMVDARKQLYRVLAED